MDILMSIILYNPLEALMCCMSVDFFEKREVKFNKYIPHIFIIGIINLFTQCIPFLFSNSVISFIMTILSMLSGIIILFMYYNHYIGNASISSCTKSVALTIAVAFSSLFVLNNIFHYDTFYAGRYFNKVYELIGNLIPRIVQLIIIYRGDLLMKKMLIKLANLYNVKAFTWGATFQPKAPKLLAKKEEK